MRIATNQLVGKFHVHLTLLCDKFEGRVKGWKTTVITLSNKEHNQIDVMLTKHYVIPSIKCQSIEDIHNDIANSVNLVESLGYKVIRVKLEHESLPTLEVSEKNYRECHIKIRMTKDYDFKCPEGFVKSANPLSKEANADVYFINKRWYKGDIDLIDQEIRESLDFILMHNIVEIIEVKQESIVSDSNNMLDKWWA